MTETPRARKGISYYMRLDYPVEITVEREDDGTYYLARVPDLPGCMSHGSTVEEALANVEDAKRAWLKAALRDGDPIPEPVPAEFSGKFVVRGSRTLHRQLVERARREGVSLNQLVVSELSRAIGSR